MSTRSAAARVRTVAATVLAEDEAILACGPCWAVQLRPRASLLFLARHQYLLALTDRRVVAVRRRRRARAEDLILAKRYSNFVLERDRRHRLLRQLTLRSANGGHLVLEFRPAQHGLAGDLAGRVSGPTDGSVLVPTGTAAPAADAPADAGAAEPQRGDAEAADAERAKTAAGDAEPTGPMVVPPGPDRDLVDLFWGDDSS